MSLLDCLLLWIFYNAGSHENFEALAFYGALRSRTYDRSISKFMDLCKVFFPLFQIGGKGREVHTNCKPSLTGENIY
ncbi:hypothetical protein ACJW30_05G204900 [Castanea mollissima]